VLILLNAGFSTENPHNSRQESKKVFLASRCMSLATLTMSLTTLTGKQTGGQCQSIKQSIELLAQSNSKLNRTMDHF
jgi:hypothetical protein